MSKAIDNLFFGLGNIKRPVARGVMTVTYDMGVFVDGMLDVRALENTAQLHAATVETQAESIAILKAERDRLAFEIQILQIGQGALQMEIERMRASRAELSAVDAIIKIGADGSISIDAGCVEIKGAVTATVPA